MSKQCSKCGETKAFKFFYRCKDRPDGYNYWCKPCCADSNRNAYNKNKQHYRDKLNTYHRTRKNRECGVYYLQTTIGDYIGESRYIQSRMYNHKCGTSCLHLGKGEYIDYKVLEYTIDDKDTRLERETYWIKKLNPSLNTLKKGL